LLADGWSEADIVANYPDLTLNRAVLWIAPPVRPV
jgi:uncharacterized protein (DUF433 family)